MGPAGARAITAHGVSRLVPALGRRFRPRAARRAWGSCSRPSDPARVPPPRNTGSMWALPALRMQAPQWPRVVSQSTDMVSSCRSLYCATFVDITLGSLRNHAINLLQNSDLDRNRLRPIVKPQGMTALPLSKVTAAFFNVILPPHMTCSHTTRTKLRIIGGLLRVGHGNKRLPLQPEFNVPFSHVHGTLPA